MRGTTWALVALSALAASCGRSGLDDGAPVSVAASTAPDASPVVDLCAEPWNPVLGPTIPLDHSDCATRVDEPCHPLFPSQPPAQADVAAAIRACPLGSEFVLRVDLVDGCPSALNGVSDAAAGCLSRALAASRWSCAGATSCALFAADTL